MEIYPKIEINLNKIKTNTSTLVKKCNNDDIKIMGVTKVFCAYPKVVNAMIDGGISYIADSRFENLVNIESALPKVLLRLPMPSKAEEIIRKIDISLNSEIKTIELLNSFARKHSKIHKIILMIELGDLREGILPKDLCYNVDKVMKLSNIKLAGIGVNLTCYGGVIPSEVNLNKLVELSKTIETKYNLQLEIISGGNSSSLFLLDEKKMPQKINNLRLGEAIALGRETAHGEEIPGTYSDACILKAEIIEVKRKPSIPTGKIGMDAFGNKPKFEDRGIRARAILAIGRQDMDPDGLMCKDKNAFVIGASSDHLIMDLEECSNEYKVGDILEFTVDYSALLKIMTSNYIYKEFID